jgi:predicted GIY-YIG superfamily endonuclease
MDSPRNTTLTASSISKKPTMFKSAIAREKQLKGWRRSRKVDLINTVNPDWHDLSEEWYD